VTWRGARAGRRTALGAQFAVFVVVEPRFATLIANAMDRLSPRTLKLPDDVTGVRALKLRAGSPRSKIYGTRKS
jgi:hypothetical protein